MAETFLSDAAAQALAGTTVNGTYYPPVASPWLANRNNADARASLMMGLANMFRVYADDSAAAAVGIYAGVDSVGSTRISYAGGTIVTLTDNASNYIWLLPAGTIAHGSAWPALCHRKLAIVAMTSGAITSITDYRGERWTGQPVGASTAAAGSAYTDAGALPAGTASVYPTTAADGTKGVIVNAADKVTGITLMIGNGVSNQILKVYPPVGGTINGASANVAFSSASGKGVIMFCLDQSANTWLAW